MTVELKKEFEYFIKNQSQLVAKFNDKFLVIKNETIIGVYDTQGEAYHQTIKTHKPGSFLIQHCAPGKEAYTQQFHSMVSFG